MQNGLTQGKWMAILLNPVKLISHLQNQPALGLGPRSTTRCRTRSRKEIKMIEKDKSAQ